MNQVVKEKLLSVLKGAVIAMIGAFGAYITEHMSEAGLTPTQLVVVGAVWSSIANAIKQTYGALTEKPVAQPVIAKALQVAYAEPLMRRRPLLTALRGFASRRGVDLSRVDDDLLEAGLEEIQLEAGSVRSLFAWMVAHPDIVLNILKGLLLFTDPAPMAAAAEVSQ